MNLSGLDSQKKKKKKELKWTKIDQKDYLPSVQNGPNEPKWTE